MLLAIGEDMSTLAKFFSFVADSFVSALGVIPSILYAICGGGGRALVMSSALFGFGFFGTMYAIVRYTPVGVPIAALGRDLVSLAGPNVAFFAWLFYDVLALDYGLVLLGTGVSLTVSAHMLYFSIRMVQRFIPV